MNVDVRPDIGINFDGVKTVVPEVVVSQREVDLARDDGAALLRVEANVEVGVFEDLN